MSDRRFSSRAEIFEASDDTPCNDSSEANLGEIVEARYSRRAILKGAIGISAAGALAV